MRTTTLRLTMTQTALLNRVAAGKPVYSNERATAVSLEAKGFVTISADGAVAITDAGIAHLAAPVPARK